MAGRDRAVVLLKEPLEQFEGRGTVGNKCVVLMLVLVKIIHDTIRTFCLPRTCPLATLSLAFYAHFSVKVCAVESRRDWLIMLVWKQPGQPKTSWTSDGEWTCKLNSTFMLIHDRINIHK